MAISRYKNINLILNDNSRYSDMFLRRGIDQIVHYSFDRFKEIKLKDVPGLGYITHIWTSSDRFFKLAYEHYGDSEYWWVIAYFNATPLETDVKVGDSLLIPTPLEVLLSAMDI
tara:strand:- start:647 stop:988 length:342 start_codon:yes stop_codon:yes gene_type:complete